MFYYHLLKLQNIFQVRDFFQNTLKKTSQIVDMKKLHNLILDGKVFNFKKCLGNLMSQLVGSISQDCVET